MGNLIFENQKNGLSVTKKPNVSWQNVEVQKELEAEGIVFPGGLFAVKIVKRKMNNPLFVLGQEDDDRLFFEKYDGNWVGFDMLWSHDLTNAVTQAVEKANKIAKED